LTIPIFAVHIVIPWWPFGRVGCQLAIAIDIIAMIVSLNLCLEVIENYRENIVRRKKTSIFKTLEGILFIHLYK